MSLFGIREREEIEQLVQAKRELHREIIRLEQKIESLKPKPREWRIPEAAEEKYLIAADKFTKEPTALNHYRFWKMVHGLFPETKNILCKTHGADIGGYFVTEVLD